MHRESLRSRSVRRWIFAVTWVTLSGIFLMLIFPAIGLGASAEEPSTDTIMSTSVNTNMTTLVRSSIAVALSSKVELDVTPKSTGAFSVSSAEMKVTTNNTTGYAVYMQTADNSSELKATNPHVEASIGPVNGTMSEGSYGSNLNTWGYAVSEAGASSNAGYKAIPQAGDEAIVRTTGISREDDYDLSFAVAVGSDLPAGLYTNQLLVSVVANPIEVRSLNDITYMQDMTAEICAITFEGETKELVDSRDGKSYKVAKLKDGNYWMVQNLALAIALDDDGNAAALSDSGTKATLDEMNTDISGKWGQGSQYPPKETELTLGEASTAVNDTRSWKVTSGDDTNWFYQFTTAVAGKALNTGTTSEQTICAKGWTMPKMGWMGNPSYLTLLRLYGINSENITEIAKEPLNFVAAGYIGNSGSHYDYGNFGDYWSRSMSGASGNGGSLVFNVKTNYFADNNYNPVNFGMNVRCVVKI